MSQFRKRSNKKLYKQAFFFAYCWHRDKECKNIVTYHTTAQNPFKNLKNLYLSQKLAWQGLNNPFIFVHSITLYLYSTVYISSAIQGYMLQYVIKEANAFINSLCQDVELTEAEINTRIWRKNNSFYFIVHHVKANRLDLVQKFYENSRRHESFNSLLFFTDLVSLISLGFQVETCKQLLKHILARQKNNQEFVSRLPLQLFQQFLGCKYEDYQKHKEELENKRKQNRIERICDNPHGYSEVLLAITVYLQNGVAKRGHKQTWMHILDIVGKHNLDFHKVIDIMLSKIVQRIDDPTTHQQLAILDNIDFNSFFALVSKNICRANQEWPKDLIVSESIFSIINQSAFQLYQKKTYFYNPRYLALITILINRGKFQAEQFIQHFHCLTRSQVINIELEKMNAVKQIMDKVFYVNMSEVNPKHVFGQALYCFRLALMAEFIKNNNFAYFQRLYRAFYPQGHFDLIIHAPLVKQLSEQIQWMIEPLYYNNSHSYRFVGYRMPKRSEKTGGYFRQYNEANNGLFQDLQLILSYLQINIGFHVKPFIKLLRVFKIILKNNSLKSEWSKLYEFKRTIKQLIKMYLLPAATLHERNPSVSWQINALLELYPQEDRFQIYQYYYHNLLFWNPYLAYLFQKITKYQYIALKQLESKNLAVLNAQLKSISKIQYNQFFQSSIYLLRRGLSIFKESQVCGKAIGASTLLSGDVMMYLSLSHLVKCSNEHEFQQLGEVIYNVILFCPALDLSLLIKLLLRKIQSPNTEEFENSMNMLQYLLEQIFPSTNEYETKKKLLQFLTYGYHLKLETMDKIKGFYNSRFIRVRLHAVLCSKIITADNKQHSIIYYFLEVLMNRINTLLSDRKRKLFQKTGDELDACMNLLNSLTHFHAFQTNRIRQENVGQVLEQNYICITQNQFKDLIRGPNTGDKVPMAIACRLLRALRKIQLFSPKNSLQPIPIKRMWDKIHNDCFFDQAEQIPHQLTLIDTAKSTHFIHSEFYFFFWTSDLENIWQMDQVYVEKMQYLRRIISTDDIFQVNNTDLDKQNKDRYIAIYKMLEKEKAELTFYYNKFNVLIPILNAQNKPLNDRVSKLTIPTLFVKQKDEAFNDFVTLFFLQCIFPRMIIDQVEAIFCSKIIYTIIKENKLPSKRSLMMIFNILQAAISYVPYSTLRETRCIAIFSSDFLRIFVQWDKMDELSVRLQGEINIEKFNDKRYEKLRDFLKQFQVKFIDSLLKNTTDRYIVSNSLQFLQINQFLPYSQGQVERINKHLSSIKFQDNSYIKRVMSILETRKKRLGSFATLNYEKQLKRHAAAALSQQTSQLTSKPKIYKQQQMKKYKTKQCINLL